MPLWKNRKWTVFTGGKCWIAEISSSGGSSLHAGGARFRQGELSKDQSAATEPARNFPSQPGSKRVEEALQRMNKGRTPETLAAASTTSDEVIANLAREGWRELGFWYDCDVRGKRWVFRADRRGIEAFAKEVREFLATPESEEIGGHVHLGPYSNLRLTRADQADATWKGIAGTRDDFEALAVELDANAREGIGGEQRIGGRWSKEDSYRLILVVEPDGFDPANAVE